MTQRLRRICVFCGSQPGNHPDYVAAARQLGELLAARGIGLVFGGGHVGMMGAVADATLAAGGEAIGVIPDGLMRRELAYEGLSQLVVTQTMHQRKQRMADLSDGFIALPGGFGTFEEFCEIVTWGMLGIHSKPIGLLNTEGYFDPLLDFLADPQGHAYYLDEGGLETFQSYRSQRWQAEIGPDELVPSRHHRFIEGLPLYLALPGWLFVHAGIRPGVGLAEQSDEDLLWIRAPFLAAQLTGGRRVVHGHTPGPEIVVTPHRIDVDTLEHVAARSLNMNEFGVANVQTLTPLSFDAYAANRTMGGFIVIDRSSRMTVGAGMIDHPLRRSANLAWQSTDIDKHARSVRNGPRLISEYSAVLLVPSAMSVSRTAAAGLA